MTGRRWLIVTAVGWGLVLVLAAAWSAQRDPATVRGQSPLGLARQTIADGIRAVEQAAGPETAVETQPAPTVVDCRLTLARSGRELEQLVVFAVPAGAEPALLERLARHLPADWDARYFPISGRLVADAGEFVAVRGEAAGPGRVEVAFQTGCRPLP